MNNIKLLQEILNIVHLADKEITQGTPLYKVKALFDDLNLNGFIEFSTDYGELIQLILDAKRKDVAAVNIIRARSVLQDTIKRLEAQQIKLDEEQQEKDDLAIESTCEVISVPRNNKEVQFQLNDMPKKLGRPSTGKALTNAERSKRARDKKKSNHLVTVNTTFNLHVSALYTSLLANGYDLSSIIELAHNASTE